jgi:signal transduction histidine kinase
MKSQMHQKLSDCYERKKDPWNALYHLKIYKQLQDSLISDETNKTIADLQIKYDTAEKEKEIERQKITLKTKSVQLLVSLIFTILIILVFVLLYIKYRHKQEIKLNEKLASEKHQRLIEVIAAEENERIRLARELHDGLGQLLSTARINMAGLDESVPENDKFLLQNALGLIDQSVTEVRQVSHNLMPVSLTRYGLIPAIEEIARQVNQAGTLKMTCSYHQTDIKFSESDERTIYRIVQELINNIIKHARLHKSICFSV